MYKTDIPEKSKSCEKNGRQVRHLTEVTKVELLAFMKRFGATETRIGKLSSRGRMIVEEGKQMLMSDAVWGDSDQSNIDSDYAINTNSGEMVNNIFILCDLLWANSKPLKI